MSMPNARHDQALQQTAAGVNRSELCAHDEVQLFHLINRCVQRTNLCCKDKRSGKDYSHRKEWLRDRLKELAAIFGIDVLGFAVMSNHLQVHKVDAGPQGGWHRV